ncbi:hypothetical protein DXM26_18540 [Agrobacterium tumefaciens]|uniref:restriction endonuclease subunit S n=1 Tax=Agrobacterium tumefaciens TaxID=358 RepID=UPI00122FF2B4|nr:hypothetical protein DXM26_18540 [Agrobacterium tumefaciens]
MNAALLNALSAAISDNPIHVLQLRKIVVALAISGRLDQTKASISRDEILALLEDVKCKLIAQRFLAKQKPVIAISSDQLPEDFSDPSKFISLGQIARVEKGKTGIQQAKPGQYPLVVTASARLTADHYDFDSAAAIIPLVSSTGHGNASINRLHYQEGQFALGTILAAVLPHEPALFSARFLFEYLSAFKEELLVSRMSGTANVTLTLGRIEEVPIPLVSPAIQRQVDELMALCDELEAARTEREAKRDRLAAASLARLNTPDQETFRDDARFALDALPALTARPDQIKQLRQTILNLAVRGKLVPQDPTDEPAEELKQIAKERQRRTKSSPLGALLPSDILPRGWTFANLSEIADFENGDRSSNYPSGTDILRSGIPFFSTKNLENHKLQLASLDYISEAKFSSLRSGKLRDRDILITLRGSVGKFGVFRATTDITTGFVNAQLLIIRNVLPEVVDFILTFMKSDIFSNQIYTRASGSATPQLSAGQLAQVVIYLPPLAEQHRIVAKVDELMALCDQLEISLTSAAETRKKLLDALLAEALATVDAEALREAAE